MNLIRSALPVALLLAGCSPPLVAPAPTTDLARLQRVAENVTITRDDWGIAHVHGRTDAEAVFGMVYAQAEDDFNRVETNFINAMGRLAETEGESAVYQDLRMKLFIDPDTLKAQYATSPAWLQSLMNGWADGLNFYLATHPAVKPRVIAHFEPWMALSFSEGSIGGDIERISVSQLSAFYGPKSLGLLPRPAPAVADVRQAAAAPVSSFFVEPSGSNGIAIAPSNSASHHALLLINPHTSFFFRSELQVTSDEGLDAYGAATWGQFFIYQGFNAHSGWMHTSSGVDVVDEFAETVTGRGGKYRLPNAPRTHRPPGKREMDQRRPDEHAGRRTRAVVPPHEGSRLRVLCQGRRAACQLLEQHHLRRCQRQHRVSAPAVHPAAR